MMLTLVMEADGDEREKKNSVSLRSNSENTDLEKCSLAAY